MTSIHFYMALKKKKTIPTQLQTYDTRYCNIINHKHQIRNGYANKYVFLQQTNQK